MENATKALLIAAGVLISIVLTAVGVKIVSSTGDTSEQASKVSEELSSGTRGATEKAKQELAKISGDKSIKFTVKVINTNNECLKTIEYNTSEDMTWEMFAKTSNNSDGYYKVETYTGGRVDVVLKVDGIERYGLRTQMTAGDTVRRDDKIDENKTYYAKAFSIGW